MTPGPGSAFQELVHPSGHQDFLCTAAKQVVHRVSQRDDCRARPCRTLLFGVQDAHQHDAAAQHTRVDQTHGAMSSAQENEEANGNGNGNDEETGNNDDDEVSKGQHDAVSLGLLPEQIAPSERWTLMLGCVRLTHAQSACYHVCTLHEH